MPAPRWRFTYRSPRSATSSIPFSPSGLPGATINPWSRCTSRTTETSRPGSSRSRYGSVYSPLSGIEQMRAGHVTEPVAQRGQPAERADVGRRERESRVAVPEGGGGEVEDEIVRAGDDDRALDLPDAPQQPHRHVLARVVALELGRHHEQPVGAYQRGEHAGAARKRGRHELPADAAEPHADPVVHAHRRGELAGESRLRDRGLGRRRALQPGEQRRGEDVEGERRRDRVAGRAEDRGPGVAVDDPEHDGMPGLTATPCTASVPASATTAAVWSSRPALEPAITITRSDLAAAVRTAATICSGTSGATSKRWASQPAASACAASITEFVSGSSPSPSSEPTGRSSSPVGITVTTGRRRTTSSVAPAAPAAATSTGRSRWPAGSSSSAALTSSPIERTCWYGAAAARSSTASPSLCTSSRMTTASKSPGIGSPVSTTSKAPASRRTGAGLARTDRVRGAHRDAVHRGGVEGRRRGLRPDRLGGHTPDRVVERQPIRLEPLGTARGRARLLPGGERLGGGAVVDERRGARHYRYSMTSTSLPAASPVAASGTTT